MPVEARERAPFTFSFVGPLSSDVTTIARKRDHFSMLVTYDLRMGIDCIRPLNIDNDYSHHILAHTNGTSWVDLGPIVQLQSIQTQLDEIHKILTQN